MSRFSISDHIPRALQTCLALLQENKACLISLAPDWHIGQFPISENTTLANVGSAELVLTGCWYIWWQRRQVVHGEDIQDPPRSALSIAAISTNYALASNKSVTVNKRWKKPSEGQIMINVDVSYKEEVGAGSTRAIIKDSKGAFIVASHSYMKHVVDATMTEAYALRDGVLLAIQIGCNRVKIQSDSVEVVTTMIDSGFSAMAAALVYDECYQLWQDFANIFISHCTRESNFVAHELARQVLLLKKIK